MLKVKSGHEFNPIKGEELKEQQRFYSSSKNGVFRLQPGGWILPSSAAKYAERISDFKFKPSDILILTFPKCGTTWMQEIVWTMKFNKTFDHPDAKDIAILRSPFIDCDMFMDVTENDGPPPPDDPVMRYFNKYCPGKDPRDGLFLQLAQSMTEPRVLKAHLPFSFFTPDLLEICKVIFVARNPKDVCVSYFHHHKLLKSQSFNGRFDQFVDQFVNDATIYSPFWEYIREGWQRRNHTNLLFCYYEDMKANPKKNYEKINEFIATGLNDEEINKIIEYTSFETMRKYEPEIGSITDEMVPSYYDGDYYKKNGGFFRKGKSGSWKSKLTWDQQQKINFWSRENLKNGFDPEFFYWNWF